MNKKKKIISEKAANATQNVDSVPKNLGVLVMKGIPWAMYVSSYRRNGITLLQESPSISDALEKIHELVEIDKNYDNKYVRAACLYHLLSGIDIGLGTLEGQKPSDSDANNDAAARPKHAKQHLPLPPTAWRNSWKCQTEKIDAAYHRILGEIDVFFKSWFFLLIPNALGESELPSSPDELLAMPNTIQSILKDEKFDVPLFSNTPCNQTETGDYVVGWPPELWASPNINQGVAMARKQIDALNLLRIHSERLRCSVVVFREAIEAMNLAMPTIKAGGQAVNFKAADLFTQLEKIGFTDEKTTTLLIDSQRAWNFPPCPFFMKTYKDNDENGDEEEGPKFRLIEQVKQIRARSRKRAKNKIATRKASPKSKQKIKKPTSR